MTRMGRSLHRPGGWIPWAFVAFFAVVLLANGTLVVFAYSSWPGLATTGAYDRGRRYNETLAAIEAQRRLGWTVGVEYEDRSDGIGDLTVRLERAGGGWLHDASVTAEFARPTSDAHDLQLAVTYRGEGRYTAPVKLPLRGQWTIRISVSHPSGDYRTVRRITVR